MFVLRTARVGLRLTKGQRRRVFDMLVAAGDVWAGLIDWNRELWRRGGAPVVNYQALCREIAGMDFGDLSVTGARSVLRRYGDAFVESARRRSRGEQARYPRRKRRLFPIRFYAGTFTLDAGRLRVPVARGRPSLWLRLSRNLPYPACDVRAVTVVCEAGQLYVDVTARVEVASCPGDGVAGVDMGIIHPFAVAADQHGLVVSGRQIRAEERLHLEDTKRRQQKMAAKKGARRGECRSRRYRKLLRNQKRAEVRHRRRVRHAHHQAAKTAVAFAAEHQVGTLAVGDLRGITDHPAGRHQNLRLRQWRRTHLIGCLQDKAAAAGITVVLVDERGTSSTCPCCSSRVSPKGRRFACPCGYRGHRDLSGPATSPVVTPAEPPGTPPWSRTVEPEHHRPGVTDAATNGTTNENGDGPALPRAAPTHHWGVARKPTARNHHPPNTAKASGQGTSG